MPPAASFESLPTWDSESGDVYVVVETPRGSRNKYKFEPRAGVFELGGVLPAGASFPFDFGFAPSTRGADGDALDVLLLMDEPAFCGCVARARLIGVIEAEQTERDGTTARNDRLIAVSSKSRNHGHLTTLDDLNENLRAEIEHFFVSYNEAKGKRFRPIGQHGPQRATALVKAGEKAFKKARRGGRRQKGRR